MCELYICFYNFVSTSFLCYLDAPFNGNEQTLTARSSFALVEIEGYQLWVYFFVKKSRYNVCRFHKFHIRDQLIDV